MPTASMPSKPAEWLTIEQPEIRLKLRPEPVHDCDYKIVRRCFRFEAHREGATAHLLAAGYRQVRGCEPDADRSPTARR
jgi:hypothetical protein